MQNKFQQYSSKEREMLITTFEPKGYSVIPTSDGGYDSFDAIIKNPATGDESIVEVKCRNFTLEHLLRNYNAELIIERHKYESLLTLAAETGRKAFYVNFLSCGAVVIFNLHKSHIVWRNNYSPKYTAKDDGSSLRVQGFCNLYLSSISLTLSPVNIYGDDTANLMNFFNSFKLRFTQIYTQYVK